LKKRTYK